jgi:hypothetical protein
MDPYSELYKFYFTNHKNIIKISMQKIPLKVLVKKSLGHLVKSCKNLGKSD